MGIESKLGIGDFGLAQRALATNPNKVLAGLGDDELVEIARTVNEVVGSRTPELISRVGSVVTGRVAEVIDKPDCSVLDAIESSATRLLFEGVFDDADLIYGRVRAKVPSAEDFSHAGVNFEELGEKYYDMDIRRLRPELIIVPCIPLDSMGRANILNLFSILGGGKFDDPLSSKFIGDGIRINDSKLKDVSECIERDCGYICGAEHIHTASETDLPAGQTRTWAIGLVAIIPQEGGIQLDCGESNSAVSAKGAQMLTPLSYLALQAKLGREGQFGSPIDKNCCGTETLLFDGVHGNPVLKGHFYGEFVSHRGSIELHGITDETDRKTVTRQIIWG